MCRIYLYFNIFLIYLVCTTPSLNPYYGPYSNSKFLVYLYIQAGHTLFRYEGYATFGSLLADFCHHNNYSTATILRNHFICIRNGTSVYTSDYSLVVLPQGNYRAFKIIMSVYQYTSSLPM